MNELKKNDIEKELEKRQIIVAGLVENNKFISNIWKLYKEILNCFRRGNKLIFCGNGGSAADCQHIVAEFIVKLSNLRKSLPAISLTSNSSIITAISNDMKVDDIFSRQIEGIARPNDILIGISTSGNSQNVIKAFEYANNNSIYTVSITGNAKNKLSQISQNSIMIPSKNTQIIQEIYIMVFHIICEKIEEHYLKNT